MAIFPNYERIARSGTTVTLQCNIRDIDNSGIRHVAVSTDAAGTIILFNSSSESPDPLAGCPTTYAFTVDVPISEFPIYLHVTDCEGRRYGEELEDTEGTESVGDPIPVPPPPPERCQAYSSLYEDVPNYTCLNAIEEVNRVGNQIRTACEELRFLEGQQTQANLAVSVLGAAFLAAAALASLPWPIGLIFAVFAVAIAIALGLAVGWLVSIRRRLDSIRRTLSELRDMYQELVDRANEVCCPWDPHPDPIAPSCY